MPGKNGNNRELYVDNKWCFFLVALKNVWTKAALKRRRRKKTRLLSQKLRC